MIHCAFFTYLSLVTGCHQSTKLPEVIRKKEKLVKYWRKKRIYVKNWRNFLGRRINPLSDWCWFGSICIFSIFIMVTTQKLRNLTPTTFFVICNIPWNQFFSKIDRQWIDFTNFFQVRTENGCTFQDICQRMLNHILWNWDIGDWGKMSQKSAEG